MKIKSILIVLLFLHVSVANAQDTLTNKVFNPYIKTVQCYNSSKEQSFPIINLKNNENFHRTF